MKFNINNIVRVKLTDKGRAFHRKEHESLPRSIPYRPPVEDEHGWSAWQLWDLMSTFGESIYNGCEPPFEIEIDIVRPRKERK